MRPNKAGFSLIELLLVASLIPIISLAVFGNLSSGFKIWRSMNTSSTSEDLSIFYEKAERDFLNASKFKGQPFVLEDDKVSFMTLITTDAALGGDRGLGEVSYFYDEAKKMIMREQRNAYNLYREEGGQRTAVLQGVSAFRLSLLDYEKASDTYTWKDIWDDPEGKRLPVAVRFETELSGPEGTSVVTKTCRIPAGGE